MALLFFDGFDRWSSGGSLANMVAHGGWTQAGNVTGRGGRRTPGRGVSCYNAAITTSYLEHAIAASTSVVVGFGFQVESGAAAFAAAGSPILQLRDSAGSHIELRSDSAGKLGVFKGTGTTTQIGSWTTTTPLAVGTWAYFELKVVIGTSGSWELRKDGAVIGSGSGDTKGSTSGSADRVRLGGLCASTGSYHNVFDDLYVIDTSGSAPFNDYLGDCAMQVRAALGQGAANDWRPRFGANIALNANGTASAINANASYPASNAFDGNSATYWQSTSNSNANDWLAFDFGSAKKIQGYSLTWLSGSSNERATAYKIQYSTDNSTWNDAHVVASAGDTDATSVLFAAQTARYWRWICTTDKNTSSSMRIASLELYDGDDTNTALQVDEAVSDDDTTYAEATAAGSTELYTLPTTAVTAGHTVGAVKISLVARKDATDSSPTIATVTRVGTTNYDGTTSATTTSFTGFETTYVQRPDGVNWSNADVEGGIQIGMKVVTN